MMTTARVVAAAAICCIGVYAGTSQAAADGDPKSFEPAARAFSWTGYYAGVQLGGLVNLSDIDDPLGASIFGNPNVASGPVAGAQIGYNYQSARIVYGVEAEIALPEVEGTSTCSSLSGQFINSSCKVGINALGTLTARLGLALGPDGRSLIYGKVGAAWTSGGVSLATNDSAVGRFGNPYMRGHTDIDRWGWTLGAGAEYALTGDWSVRAEYDFADFGNHPIELLPSAYMAESGSTTESVPRRQGQIAQTTQQFKLGVNYSFGEGSASASEHAGREVSGSSLHPAKTPFGFEMGGRYWYSWGRHKYDLASEPNIPSFSNSLFSRMTYDDIWASTAEVTAQVTIPRNLFAKGFVGGGSILDGHLNDEDFNLPGERNIAPNTPERIPYTNTISSVDGDVPWYGTMDAGYDWWRGDNRRLGTFVGFSYYAESLNAYGVRQIANQAGPGGLDAGGPVPAVGHPVVTQDSTWQSLRLGATTEFYLASHLKLSAEAAYLPYVSVSAVDQHYLSGTGRLRSINPLDGEGVGAQLEMLLSYDVTENLSLGTGARYWAMWTTDASFRRVYDAQSNAPPSAPQPAKIETERAGLLGQIMYKFD